MSQLIKPQIKWTPEKIELLKSEYPLGDKAKLALDIGVSRKVLKYAARRFGVKSLRDRRKYSALRLLDETDESYYWQGFIMADGHISRRNSIVLALAMRDESHITNFKKFLKSNVEIKYLTSKTGYIKNVKSARVTVPDIHTCEQLRIKYNVMNNKTTSPPDLEFLLNNRDRFISFFIGFFDGDGCFCFSSTDHVSGVKIECHPNWLGCLHVMAKGLSKYFDIHPNVRINNRGYAKFTFGKYKNFVKLKNIITELKIPAMVRKWDNIDPERYFRGKTDKQ